MFLSSQRILAASLVAYVCGQLIDIFVFHKLKALSLFLAGRGSPGSR